MAAVADGECRAVALDAQRRLHTLIRPVLNVPSAAYSARKFAAFLCRSLKRSLSLCDRYLVLDRRHTCLNGCAPAFALATASPRKQEFGCALDIGDGVPVAAFVGCDKDGRGEPMKCHAHTTPVLSIRSEGESGTLTCRTDVGLSRPVQRRRACPEGPIICRTSILQTGLDERCLDEVCERPKTPRLGVGLHTLKSLDQIISASLPLAG